MKAFKLFSILSILILFNSCSSSSDDTTDQNNESSLLIGKWYRLSSEDQDGNITDDTNTCYVVEFTESDFIATDYIDADCTTEFSSGGFPYTKIENYVYYGEVSQDIKHEITELSQTTLKLKGEDMDQGIYYSDTVTFERM